MILCHFYLSSKNLLDIKIIIQHGRAILENFSLLFLSCLFCAAIIDIYLIISFEIIKDIKPEHLRVFNSIYYSLSLFGFTNSVDSNISNKLKQNNELFNKYILIQFFGNIIIKSYDIIFFYYFYRKNTSIEVERRNLIYISYWAILSFNLIFSTLFGFNYIRFYRKNFYDNFLFVFSLIVFYLIILFVTCLSRKGFKNIFSAYYTFENLHENSDTFDDRNKLLMFMIITIDLFSTFVFISIVQYFFNKNSQKKIKQN
jgi:magnesium-transporting ATPase (P-type)